MSAEYLKVEHLKIEIQNISKERLGEYVKRRLFELNYALNGWEEYIKAEMYLLEDLNPKNKHSISRTKKHIDYANDMINDIKENIKYLNNIGVFL